MMTDAKFIKTIYETKDKTQRLYKLNDDKIIVKDYSLLHEDLNETTEYFLVSRVHADDHGDWETLLFPADEQGKIMDYLEIWGTRGWEPIQTTVDGYLDMKRSVYDEERLQSCQDKLD